MMQCLHNIAPVQCNGFKTRKQHIDSTSLSHQSSFLPGEHRSVWRRSWERHPDGSRHRCRPLWSSPPLSSECQLCLPSKANVTFTFYSQVSQGNSLFHRAILMSGSSLATSAVVLDPTILGNTCTWLEQSRAFLLNIINTICFTNTNTNTNNCQKS